MKSPAVSSWAIKCICVTFTGYTTFDFVERATSLSEAYAPAEVSAAIAALKIVDIISIYPAPLN